MRVLRWPWWIGLAACGPGARELADATGASDARATADAPITPDAMRPPDATPRPDAPWGECDVFGPPASNVGIASYVPGGAPAGADFQLAWWTVLVHEAGKGIPRAADLDGDHAVDLVINPRHGASVMVFPNQGDATFGAPVLLPGVGAVGVSGWATDLGDLDGDGVVDIVLGDHADLAKAWVNQGGMTFTSFDAGLVAASYSGVGLGDVSGDGRLDALFGADQFSGGFRLFFGTATGWVQQAPSGLPPWSTIEAEDLEALRNFGHTVFADYDHDGDLDIFAFGETLGAPGTIAFVFRNDGAGTAFTEIARLHGGSFPAVGNPLQGQVADANADGFVDVLAGGRLFLWDGTGWVGAVEVDPADTSQLADINGDCWLDIVTSSREHGLRVYYGDGTGLTWTLAGAGLPDQHTFPAALGNASVLDSPYGVAVADLDGNGRLDLVRSYKAEGTQMGEVTVLEAWVR